MTSKTRQTWSSIRSMREMPDIPLYFPVFLVFNINDLPIVVVGSFDGFDFIDHQGKHINETPVGWYNLPWPSID